MVGGPSCNDGGAPSCNEGGALSCDGAFFCNKTAKRSQDVWGLKKRGVEGLKKEELVKEKLQNLDVVGSVQVVDGGDGW